MAAQRNILVFFTDQQRYDSLGCSDNSSARTPHIDELAAAGCRMENHIAANPICMPSRASFFTGRFPNAHRLWHNGVPLPDTETTLPQVLQGQGYDTASFGKIHLNPTEAHASPELKESAALWRRGELDNWHGPYLGFDRVGLTIDHGERALREGHYANEVRKRLPNLEEILQRGRSTGSQDFI